ncbi:MAG: SLC13 family permease [Luteibaculaceae bacterium]
MQLNLKEVTKTMGFIGTYPVKKLTQAIGFLGRQSRLNKIAPPLTKKELSIFLTALIPAILVVFWLKGKPDVNQETAYMAGIFVLACLLWATEALPLFATALLIIGLEIILLANPAGWSGLGMVGVDAVPYTHFLKPLSDPMLVLFFGGFLLARASVKAGVDGLIASKLLKPFLANPIRLLMGVMLITAVFSMWMSNTATTAMMLSLLAPILIQLTDDKNFAKALILAVPFGANIGGLGTPVASPPNAVAVGYLEKLGYSISFTQWVAAAIVPTILMLLIAFFLLKKYYKPENPKRKFTLEVSGHDPWANYVMFIFAATVILWLTEALHKIPAPVISMLPVIGFTATGLLDKDDVNSIEWNILLLIAGGIALGMGMSLTGLDTLIVENLNADSLFLVPLLIVAMILLSNFMSNTAAANLMIPIGISMMQIQSFGPLGIFAGTLAMALAASLAMALPVSTPPNALAYASGKLDNKDFIKVGSIIGVIGAIVIIIFFLLAGFGQKLGLLPTI